jgi:hypothetical protein
MIYCNSLSIAVPLVMVFLAYPKFHQDAKNAKTPPGDAATFTDLDAQVSTNTYLGL